MSNQFAQIPGRTVVNFLAADSSLDAAVRENAESFQLKLPTSTTAQRAGGKAAEAAGAPRAGPRVLARQDSASASVESVGAKRKLEPGEPLQRARPPPRRRRPPRGKHGGRVQVSSGGELLRSGRRLLLLTLSWDLERPSTRRPPPICRAGASVFLRGRGAWGPQSGMLRAYSFLHPGIAPGRIRQRNFKGLPGIEPGSVTYKAESLHCCLFVAFLVAPGGAQDF